MRSERGSSVVEFGILLALVAVVSVAAVGALGDRVYCNYWRIEQQFLGGVETATGGPPGCPLNPPSPPPDPES